MSYLMQDQKDLQEVWEQLLNAITDLETSDFLSETEREQKAQIVKRLNRRYDVLSNRARTTRQLEIKRKEKRNLKVFVITLTTGFLATLVASYLLK